MSTITSSTSSTSYTNYVSSFKNSAEDLIKDQVSIGSGGTYDTYVASTSTEFENPNGMDLSGIYSAAMGNNANVEYGENGDVKSVDIEGLTYARMTDYQDMLKTMLGEEISETSISDMVSSLLSATNSASTCSVTTALTTDGGAYSIDSVADSIIDMASEIACDDLDVLAELKDAFVEAYENSGDSDSALSSDTYTKVLAGFATLEAEITARLEAAAEAETETDLDVDTETETETDVEVDVETEVETEA